MSAMSISRAVIRVGLSLRGRQSYCSCDNFLGSGGSDAIDIADGIFRVLVVWDLNPSNTSSNDLQGGPTAEHLHHSDDANCVKDYLRVSGITCCTSRIFRGRAAQHVYWKDGSGDYLAWSWSSETKAGSVTHAVLGGLQAQRSFFYQNFPHMVGSSDAICCGRHRQCK